MQELSSTQLRAYVRRQMPGLIHDESGNAAVGTAIYTLADPRTAREPRYVGKTQDPAQRFLQHMATARLWLPDETPWWVKMPRMRPLYTWLRSLYRDDGRLPVMIVSAWLEDAAAAQDAERTRIYECLHARVPLLNVESQTLGPRVPLL